MVKRTRNALHAGTLRAAIVVARDIAEGKELFSNANNPNERGRVHVIVMSRVDEGCEVVVQHLPLRSAFVYRSSGPLQRPLELQATSLLAAVDWSFLRGRGLAFCSTFAFGISVCALAIALRACICRYLQLATFIFILPLKLFFRRASIWM